MAAVSLLMVSCFAFPAIAAAEDSSYEISFDASSVSYLGTGEKGTVVVNIGADRPAGNYTYTATMSNGTVSPSTSTGSWDTFSLAVTAPSSTGDITLTVKVTSVSSTVNDTETYTIHVIKPVAISAVVKNSGNVTMENVPVRFYVDDVVVNSTTFTVAANSTKTIYYNWTAVGLSNGEHSVKIEIDANNEFVSFIDGTKVFTSKFYVGDSGWGIANILLAIVFVLLLVIVFFSYMGKGKKRKRT